MPLILGIFTALLVIYFAVAILIPTFAVWIVTALIGRTAKLCDIDSFKLGIYFYLVTGTLYGVAAIFEENAEGFTIIGYLIVCTLLWPFPMIFEFFGVMTGMSISTIIGIFIFSFAITQLIAVHMILQQTKDDTEKFG